MLGLAFAFGTVGRPDGRCYYRSKVALHQLRIGIKHLRYIVENFLPEQDQAWGKDFGAYQDLLGEVHDLDVLWSTACQIHAFATPQERQKWYAAVSRERAQRMQAYCEKMIGRQSLWQEWRNGFPAGEELQKAVVKRFEIWATSLDPDPTHSRLVTKFSLLNSMMHCKVRSLVHARSAGAVKPRDLLQVAALTHGVGHDGRSKSQTQGQQPSAAAVGTAAGLDGHGPADHSFGHPLSSWRRANH